MSNPLPQLHKDGDGGGEGGVATTAGTFTSTYGGGKLREFQRWLKRRNEVRKAAPGLVAEKVPVHREGRVFSATRWKRPNKQDTPATAWKVFYTRRAAVDFAAKEWEKEDVHTLPIKERNAITMYKSARYKDINRALRGMEEARPNVKNWVNQLDNVVGRHKVSQNIVVFRGVRSSVLAEAWAKLPEGAVIHDRGFVSTTLEPDFISRWLDYRGVVELIKIPAGSRAGYLSGSELEVLLPRNSQFKITASYEKSGHRYLELEYIGQAEEPVRKSFQSGWLRKGIGGAAGRFFWEEGDYEVVPPEQVRKAVVPTPMSPEGRLDTGKVQTGDSVWITIGNPESPLHGRHVLITKRPDGLFAITGGGGGAAGIFNPEVEARRHLVITGSPRQTTRDKELRKFAERAEDYNAPILVAKKKMEAEARRSVTEAADHMLKAIGVERLDKTQLLKQKDEVQNYVAAALPEGEREKAKQLTDSIMRQYVTANRKVAEQVQRERQVVLAKIGKRLASLGHEESAEQFPEILEEANQALATETRPLAVAIPDVKEVAKLATPEQQESAIARHFDRLADDFFEERKLEPVAAAEEEDKAPQLSLGTVKPLEIKSEEELHRAVGAVKNYWEKRHAAEEQVAQLKRVPLTQAGPSTLADLKESLKSVGDRELSPEELEDHTQRSYESWVRGNTALALYEAVGEHWNDRKSLVETVGDGNRVDSTMRFHLNAGAAVALSALAKEHLGERMDYGRLVDGTNIDVAAAMLAYKIRQGASTQENYDRIVTQVRDFNARNQVATEQRALERHAHLKSQWDELQRQKANGELVDRVRIAALETGNLLEQRKNLGAAIGSLQASATFYEGLTRLHPSRKANSMIEINTGDDLKTAEAMVSQLGLDRSRVSKQYDIDSSDPDNIKLRTSLDHLEKDVKVFDDATAQRDRYEALKTDVSGTVLDEQGNAVVEHFEVPGWNSTWRDEEGTEHDFHWRLEQRNDINWLRAATEKSPDNPEGTGGGMITRVTGAGKCLAWEEAVYLADGRVLPAFELIGQTVQIIGVTDTHTMKQVPVMATFSDNGFQYVVELLLDTGLKIYRTEEHPLWVGQISDREALYFDSVSAVRKVPKRHRIVHAGWVEAAKIQPAFRIAGEEGYKGGDAILCPKKINQQGTKLRDDTDVILCAVLLAEGCLTGHSKVHFSTASEGILQAMQDAAEANECVVLHNGHYDYRIVAKERHIRYPANKVLVKTREWGIRGKATEKAIPQWVFELPNEQVALFLRYFFECDGWVGKRSVSVGLANAKMVRQLSQLAARLGIVGTFVSKTNAYAGSWRWDTSMLSEWKERIGLIEKVPKLEVACERQQKVRSKPRFCSPEQWRVAQPNEFQKFANCPSGYWWRRVVSTKLIQGPTVAVEVHSDNHAFIGDVVEHNTNASLGFLAFKMHEDPEYKALVTVPRGRAAQWGDEARKFSRLNVEVIPDGLARDKVDDLLLNSKAGTIYVMGHREAARSSAMLTELQTNPKLNKFHGLVIDEPQELQARGGSGNIGEQGRRIMRLPVQHRLGLTATPARRNPLEVYDLIKWTSGTKSLGARTAFNRIFSGFGSGTNAQDTTINKLYYDTIAPYISGDRLTAPDFKVRQDAVEVRRSPQQVARQQEIERTSAERVARRRQELTREVRENPNHPWRRVKDWEAALPRKATEEARREVELELTANMDDHGLAENPKLQALRDNLRADLGRKHVIYIDGRVQKKAVDEVFQNLGLRTSQVKNLAASATQMTGAEMARRAHEFRTNKNIPVIVIDKVSASGYNLQQGDVLHVLGTPPDAANYLQAQGRVARAPRKGDVTVRTYRYADNPVEAAKWNDLDAQMKLLRASSPGLFVGV